MLQNFNFKIVVKAFIISLVCFFAYGSFIIGTNIFTDRLAFLIIFCCVALSLNYGVTTNTNNLNRLNLLFFLCCSILPLICKITDSSWSVSNHYGEYLLSFTSLLLIQLLYSILFLEKRNNLFLKVLATTLSWCFCALQLLIGFYYLATKTLLNDFAILAVCQTNPSEALSYVRDYIPVWLLLLTIITFLGLLILFWRIFSNYNSLHFTTAKTKVTLLLSAFMLLDLYIFFVLCPTNFIQRTSYSVQNSLDTYKEFRELRQKTLTERQQNSFEAKYTGNSPGTYVLVIGESETRDHMGAYGYFRSTTPWLSKEVKSNSNLILFPHAYACANATTRVLSLALTESNQYNNVSLNKALSIIDVAKKAGFETVWLSNQMRYGKFDSPTTIIAESADKQIWENDNIGIYTRANQYDSVLLKDLQKFGRLPNKNRLIIVHLMGCHGTYTDRYPPQEEYFNTTADIPAQVKNKMRYNAYDNAVRYNDYILSQICTVAKIQLHAKAITYFSDHGEELVVGYGHNPILDKYDYTLLRVPFFIELNVKTPIAPTIFANLQVNRNKYFTNDIVYDTQLGLMEITTNRSSKIYDLTSNKFGLTLSDLIATEQKYKISNDPTL